MKRCRYRSIFATIAALSLFCALPGLNAMNDDKNYPYSHGDINGPDKLTNQEREQDLENGYDPKFLAIVYKTLYGTSQPKEEETTFVYETSKNLRNSTKSSPPSKPPTSQLNHNKVNIKDFCIENRIFRDEETDESSGVLGLEKNKKWTCYEFSRNGLGPSLKNNRQGWTTMLFTQYTWRKQQKAVEEIDKGHPFHYKFKYLQLNREKKGTKVGCFNITIESNDKDIDGMTFWAIMQVGKKTYITDMVKLIRYQNGLQPITIYVPIPDKINCKYLRNHGFFYNVKYIPKNFIKMHLPQGTFQN